MEQLTEEQKQQVIAQHEAQKKLELSDRMRKLGQSRSPKKRKAVRKNIKAALKKRWGKKT